MFFTVRSAGLISRRASARRTASAIAAQASRSVSDGISSRSTPWASLVLPWSAQAISASSIVDSATSTRQFANTKLTVMMAPCPENLKRSFYTC